VEQFADLGERGLKRFTRIITKVSDVREIHRDSDFFKKTTNVNITRSVDHKKRNKVRQDRRTLARGKRSGGKRRKKCLGNTFIQRQSSAEGWDGKNKTESQGGAACQKGGVNIL